MCEQQTGRRESEEKKDSRPLRLTPCGPQEPHRGAILPSGSRVSWGSVFPSSLQLPFPSLFPQREREKAWTADET